MIHLSISDKREHQVVPTTTGKQEIEANKANKRTHALVHACMHITPVHFNRFILKAACGHF
jgi:hypothetical protein